MKTQAETVHLVPTGTHYIPGVPAIEQDVSPEVAAELLAYHPAAFSTSDTLPAAEPDIDPADEPKE